MEEFKFDNLFSGLTMPQVTEGVVIPSGSGVVKVGTVLGRITASGKNPPVDSTKEDGSEKPYAVLSKTVDATNADVKTVAYVTGEFNEAALLFGGTDTVSTHRVAMRERCMFVRKVVPV